MDVHATIKTAAAATTARTPAALNTSKITKSTKWHDVLNHAKASESTQKKPTSINDAKLEKTAQTLVNQFFMGSMMKQMHDSPFKDDKLSGGRAGEAYAGMFDQHIAEHAGNRIAKDLVQSMVKQYSKYGSKNGVTKTAAASFSA